MKYSLCHLPPGKAVSRPARALWIEIAKLTNYRIEQLESRPARALWIEISLIAWNASLAVVEAREGLVD